MSINIGEMQRKLSLWAEQDKERKFHDLFDLICNVDWLWLAYEYVAQNAGSKTAGCDGIDVMGFYENEVDNIKRLYESLKSGSFEACPVRRVYIPKSNGKMRPLGIPMALAYCTSLQATWGNDLGRFTPPPETRKGSVRVERPPSPLIPAVRIPLFPHSDERCFHCCRTAFRF